MILHNVVYAWAPGTSDADVDRLERDLRQIAGTVDGLLTFETARDGRYRDGSADFSIIATFRDEEALRSYFGHPEHHRMLDEYGRAMTARREGVQAAID